jgi:hypothetical protein
MFQKLVDLYQRKSGEYAENGKMPVCFIPIIPLENSGSPAID